ncbi:MAG: ABC transporter permease [Acidimicrobiales bacterium]
MPLNPVLGREIKERMRSARAVAILMGYLGLLAGILYLAYRGGLLFVRNMGVEGGGAFGSAALGRTMFEWLLFFLLVFVSFIAPGIAAGAVVGERERRTLHLLQLTLLKPRSIVLGKLGASMAFLVLLVLATAPLFAVPLVLGGVTPWQVLRGFLVVVALMAFLAASGTYLSSVARRTQFATVISYALTFVVLVGTLFLYGAESIYRSVQRERKVVICDPGPCEPQGLYRPLSPYLNPFAAMADAVVDQRAPQFGMGPSPFSMFRGMLGEQFFATPMPMPMPMPMEPGADGDVRILDGRPGRPGFPDRPHPLLALWTVHIGILLAASLLFLLLASRRLRAPARRFVIGRRNEL